MTTLPAHPVAEVGVRADVEANRVVVKMEVALEDLVFFHAPKVGTNAPVPASVLKPLAERHAAFLLEHFTVLDEQGNRLPGRVENWSAGAIPAAGVAPEALKAVKLPYELAYPLAAPPRFLTFLQRFGGANAPVPAQMDLTVTHGGGWTGNAVKCAWGRPHSVELEWENGAPKVPRSLAEIRAFKERRRQERLGLEDLNGVYSFIYLEPFRVRLELVFPYAALLERLQSNRPVQPADAGSIGKSEIELFLRNNVVVKIHGRESRRLLQSVTTPGIDVTDLGDAPFREARPRMLKRVALSLVFPMYEPFEEVEFTWNCFDDEMRFLTAAVHDGSEAARIVFFTPDRRTQVLRRANNHHAKAETTTVMMPHLKISNGALAAGAGVFIAACLVWRRRRSTEQMFGRVHGGLPVLAGLVLMLLILARTQTIRLPQPFYYLPEMSDVEWQTLLRECAAKSAYFRVGESLYASIENGWRVPGLGEEGGAGYAVIVNFSATGWTEHWGHAHAVSGSCSGTVYFSKAGSAWVAESGLQRWEVAEGPARLTPVTQSRLIVSPADK